MSDRVAVRLTNVGKMYKIFASRGGALLDALGLTWTLPGGRLRYREFWALREIDLRLERAQRLGVIGRNGAGKTTLLRLITGNISPTEGAVEVRGQVQALLEMGGGLHPEFTGHENIRAALTYRGLGPEEIATAEADITEFTELGEFLAQPFKTYSLGMQARLAFAIATAVQPEILIVDEILGAGDAYFFAKSTERMQALVRSGASVLIVSHALEQIIRFCEETIWLERGRVVMRGPSLEVVRAYETFTRVLEDRRLRAKNRKLRSRAYTATQRDNYADHLVVRFTWGGRPGEACDVAEIALWKGDEEEDRLFVGHAQDGDTGQSAFVVLDAGEWSAPRVADGRFCRSLLGDGGLPGVLGSALFYLWVFEPGMSYTVEVRYRAAAGGSLMVEVLRQGAVLTAAKLPAEGGDWLAHRVPLEPDPRQERSDPLEAGGRAGGAGEADRADRAGAPGGNRLRHWPGEGSLRIEDVALLGPDRREQAVFSVGTPMVLLVTFRAERSGAFPVIPAAVLYRVDGIRVSAFIGPSVTLELTAGQRREACLGLGPLGLGDGRYVFAVALYRTLSHLEASEYYDLIDQSCEFAVVGNRPFAGVFEHPGEWSFR